MEENMNVVCLRDAEPKVIAEKAAEILGWSAEYNIEDMCRDSYNWQVKNPNGYDE